MADSPSPLLQMRIQSVGSNVNLWGGYINTDLGMLEQAAKGYQTLVVTGDAVVSWTNYAPANMGSCARLKLTGALGAPATLTFPSFQNFLSVENAAGHTVTIKCSGGAGVTIASGQRASLYCDGVDYYNAAPTRFPTANVTFAGQLKGVAAATDAMDAPNLSQVSALIAAGGIPGAPGTVKVDALAASVYLGRALTAGAGVSISDSGDNLELSATPYWSAPRYVDGAASPVQAVDRDIIYVDTSAAVEIDLPAAGRVWIIDQAGAAQINNITVDPPGVDTATVEIIDLNYFSGVFTRAPSGNWEIS